MPQPSDAGDLSRLGYNADMSITDPASSTPRVASGTQLLDKALDMIDLVERSSHRLTANAIARACGYPKPTVNRILSALVRRGFLAIDRRDQSYELGMRFTQLAATLRRSHHLVTLVEENLVALSAHTGETVSLGVAEPTAVRIVGRYHLGLETVPGGPTGAKRPYHASAIGKAILSGMTEKLALRHIARSNFERFTPGTICERDKLLSDLQLVRARGYALDNEEIVTGVRCVAVPIFAASGEIIAALSLSAPVHRMTAERIGEVVTALSAIADKAAERLEASSANRLFEAGITCVRAGGLFRPAAVASTADGIKVVDAAAPAIYTFSPNGNLLDTLPLAFIPDTAAIAPDGGVLLARHKTLEYHPLDGEAKIIELAGAIGALTFASEDRGFALGQDGILYDALQGTRLFDMKVKASALAIWGQTIFLLADNGERITLHDATDGRLKDQISLSDAEGLYNVMATDGHYLWISGDTWRVDRIDIATGTVKQLMLPERSITALAIEDQNLLIAGSNLHAALIDKTDHSAGSLYRVRFRE